eukprot:TRINITY_DN68162_c0_g1_i1.p1 TRINITY_DN68162_c0_g1~~TRINITY_DN68162_c0_g1_i1.p1  ORF type:complete len:415 (-),score=58.27 TRINITY_DN68162_c0_g1_i1:400-1644(-)
MSDSFEFLDSSIEGDLYLTLPNVDYSIPEEISYAPDAVGSTEKKRRERDYEPADEEYEEDFSIRCVLGPERLLSEVVVPRNVTFPQLQQVVESTHNKRLCLSFKLPLGGFTLLSRLRRAAKSSSGVHLALKRQQYMIDLLRNDKERTLVLDQHTLPLFLRLPAERRELICRPLYALPKTEDLPQKAPKVAAEPMPQISPAQRLRLLKKREKTLVSELKRKEGRAEHPPLSAIQEHHTVKRLYESHVDRIRRQRKEDDQDAEERFQRLQPVARGPPSESELRIVESLYTNGTAKRDATLKRLNEQYLDGPVCKVKLMVADDVEESVKRLYTQGKQRKAERNQAAEQLVYPTAPSKQFSASEQKHSVDKLYALSIERRNEKLKKVETENTFQPRLVKRLDPVSTDKVFERLTVPKA